MNRIIFGIALLCSTLFVFADGENCSATKLVNACPSTRLTSETTAGMGNDKINWKQSAVSSTIVLNGNDKVYEVNLPTGATHLWVETTSSFTMRVIYTAGTCDPTYYTSMNTVSGSCQKTIIPVSGLTTVYITIDHSNVSDLTYDISFSAVTGTTTVSRGNIYSSNYCTSPLFKPYVGLGLKYNGSQMSMPLFYSPLFTPGVVCYQLFLENTSGKESVKSVQFTFGNDISNVSPVTSSFPGFYAAGTWNATQSGKTITYTFTNVDGRGDYDDVNSTCRKYEFYMNMTPNSNDPFGTLTSYTWTGDGYGGTFYTGCFNNSCSGNCSASNCTAPASGVSSGGGSTYDPPLPLDLLSFNATYKDGDVQLEGLCAKAEFRYLQLERSANGSEFMPCTQIIPLEPGGNGFSILDENVPAGKLLYRLKVTNEDGTFDYSEIIPAENNFGLSLYPNPVTTTVTVQGSRAGDEVLLYDQTGNLLWKQVAAGEKEYIDVADLPSGIYFIKVISSATTTVQSLFVE